MRIDPKEWNKRFTQEVLTLGLRNTVLESCLCNWREEVKRAAPVLCFDDFLIASNVKEKLEAAKQKFNQVFEMKNMEGAQVFFSI